MNIWLQFITCVLIWGSTWIAIKYQIGEVPTPWSVTYRFVAAALLLAALVIVRKARPAASLKQHVLLLGYGLFQFCLNFQLVYQAEKTVPSGLMAILFALMVITNPVMARLVFGSRISAATFAGGALGVMGVGLMFSPQIQSISLHDIGLQGLGVGLLGVLCASVGNMFAAAPLLRKLEPATSNLWAMAYGASASALFASTTAGPPVISFELPYLAGLAFVVIFGSVVGFGCYVNIIRQKGLTVAAYVGVCVPIVALAWSWTINEFAWGWTTAAGIVLVLAGMLVALRPNGVRAR